MPTALVLDYNTIATDQNNSRNPGAYKITTITILCFLVVYINYISCISSPLPGVWQWMTKGTSLWQTAVTIVSRSSTRTDPSLGPLGVGGLARESSRVWKVWLSCPMATSLSVIAKTTVSRSSKAGMTRSKDGACACLVPVVSLL